MRRLPAYLVVGLLSVSALSTDAQEIRVMQWNILDGLGRQSNNSSSQARALARIVSFNQPDIILLNEVDADGLNAAQNEAAIIDWVTNDVPYLGAQPGMTFYVAVSSQTDNFNRNAAISRYPILAPSTYDDGLRGLHSFRVQLASTNALQVFHTHLKCCSDDCTRKQTEAQFDADTMSAWAATNSIPYILAGDLNEDEESPVCTLTSTYHPITTIREEGGVVEFKPTTLSGEHRTWSTTSASIRFDYILAATNRLSPAAGFVFSTMDWAAHGLYTNVAGNLVNDSQTASDHYCVVADYSFPTGPLPPTLAVSPNTAFNPTGAVGGPFSPATQNYTLSNTGSSALDWTASNSAGWLNLSATNGTLAAGASTIVTGSVNATASGLAAGIYADTIAFTNTTAGAGSTTRAATLTAVDPNAGGFADDVESGTNGWTATGFWHVVSAGMPSCAVAHSPTHAWWYGRNNRCNYTSQNPNSGDLISPSFIVPVGGKLSFWSWEDVQPGASTTYDQRTVSVSTNAGASWIQLHQSTDDSEAWYQVSIDLSALAGKTAQLRFRFDTVDDLYNAYTGWFVDDMQVWASDGISDAWRQTYFGHVDPRADDLSRAEDNPDGDGLGNLTEYVFGSVPTDAGSAFALQIARLGDGSVQISFPSLTGREYTVEYRDEMTSGSWLPVGSFTDEAGTGSTMSYVDSFGNSARYYRLRGRVP